MTRALQLMTILATIVALPWPAAPNPNVPPEINPDLLIRERMELIAPETTTSRSRQPAPSGTNTWEINVESLGAEQTEIVESALGTYERAGLPLPSGLTVEFHQTSGPCARGVGAYRPVRALISICSVHRDPDIADAKQRRVLVHELAHAWAESFLEPQRQQAFMKLRGLEAWRSADLHWRDRGTEHAADIITWGILDGDILFLAIDNKSCDTLDEAFRVLTGLVPMAGLTHNCED